MTLDGQAPLRYSRMNWTISVALRPAMRGITESGIRWAAWQPVHELAPGGAVSAAPTGPLPETGQQESAGQRRQQQPMPHEAFFSS